MCRKKKRLEDIYTCTHMNGSLLSVHTSEQIGVHVSISIIVLQNVHFVIFFPSIFLHRKGIHTTPGKAAHPCNHASLLFAWDNTALCFCWGREGGGGGIPPGDNLWSLSVFDYIVLIHWQNDKLKGVMSSSMSGTALRFLKRSHDIMWVEATYPVSHHSSKVKRWDQIHISIVFHNKPCSVTTQIPISFYIQSNVNSVS